MQAQLKTEHSLAQSTKIWNQDILPNWEKVWIECLTFSYLLYRAFTLDHAISV